MQAANVDRRSAIVSAVIFSGLVTLTAWLSPLLGGGPSNPGPGFVLWAVSPLLVSIVLRIARRDWSDLGLRPKIGKNVVWYVVSLLAYPAAMVFALVVGGLLSVSSLTEISIARYFQIALTAFPFFFVFAIFEEVGWRGYLAPKLEASGLNRFVGHAIVGVVWASWHLPFLRDLSWMYTSEDPVTFIPRLYLGAIAFSILYGEIRGITGVFWPAVLMHAVGNAFGHPLAAEAVKVAAGKQYLGSIGWDGLLMIGFFGLTGVLVSRWRTRRQWARPDS